MKGEDGLLHLPEKGDNKRDYAVIKHQFGWGDIWVICLRCGKKWKPGMPGYDEALKFPTTNSASTALQYGARMIDQVARDATKES